MGGEVVSRHTTMGDEEELDGIWSAHRPQTTERLDTLRAVARAAAPLVAVAMAMARSPSPTRCMPGPSAAISSGPGSPRRPMAGSPPAIAST